ncbi:MAG: TonB family protein [Candidatus Ozemobacteraceae bacterium]
MPVLNRKSVDGIALLDSLVRRLPIGQPVLRGISRNDHSFFRSTIFRVVCVLLFVGIQLIILYLFASFTPGNPPRDIKPIPLLEFSFAEETPSALPKNSSLIAERMVAELRERVWTSPSPSNSVPVATHLFAELNERGWNWLLPNSSTLQAPTVQRPENKATQTAKVIAKLRKPLPESASAKATIQPRRPTEIPKPLETAEPNPRPPIPSVSPTLATNTPAMNSSGEETGKETGNRIPKPRDSRISGLLSSTPGGRSDEEGVSGFSQKKRIQEYVLSLRAELLRRKRFPEQARALDIEGTPILEFSIDLQGQPSEVKVKGAAPALLAKTARELVLQAPFAPPPAGWSCSTRIEIPISFRLR